MSITILDDNREGEAVRVTAADYNGALENPFDGCPFSATPAWLQNAMDKGWVTVYPDNRDYACWKVFTFHGEIIAEPGDFIIHRPGKGLEVYAEKSGRG